MRYTAIYLLLAVSLTGCYRSWKVTATGTISEKTYFRLDGSECTVSVLQTESIEGEWPHAGPLPLARSRGQMWHSKSIHPGDRVQIKGKIHINHMFDMNGNALSFRKSPYSSDTSDSVLQLRVRVVKKLPAAHASQPDGGTSALP